MALLAAESNNDSADARIGGAWGIGTRWAGCAGSIVAVHDGEVCQRVAIRSCISGTIDVGCLEEEESTARAFVGNHLSILRREVGAAANSLRIVLSGSGAAARALVMAAGAIRAPAGHDDCFRLRANIGQHG